MRGQDGMETDIIVPRSSKRGRRCASVDSKKKEEKAADERKEKERRAKAGGT